MVRVGLRLRLRGRVRVNFVATVRVSKLLGSKFNPNRNSNCAPTLTLISY